MNPFVSWALFVIGAAAFYWLSQRNKTPASRRHEPLQEKSKPVSGNTAGSGTDAGEAKKKAKKKKKSALSSSVSKEVVSTDDGGNKSDDDVAEEVDLRDVARRMARRQGANLAPSVSPYAASQTSSTGADGDIDEEDAAPLKSSSSDPSDMLEVPTGGPGVLKIGAPAQPPRSQKKKVSSSAPEAGIHATKNAKKKEKKKAEREAERADQQARFEQHRKAMRAEEAKNRPTQAEPASSSSAWTTVGGKKPPAPVPAIAAPVSESSSSALLDTFTPADSGDEKVQQSTTLGDSWESIPVGLRVPEPEWNEVKSKKTRKDRKPDDSDVPKSSDEAPKPKPVAPAPEFKPVAASKPAKAPKPAPVQKKSSNNNFNVLDTASASDARTTSGSDWAEVENIENWAVHPESSDY